MPLTFCKSLQFWNAELSPLRFSRYATIAPARVTPKPGSLTRLSTGASFGFILLSSVVSRTLRADSLAPSQTRPRQRQTARHALITNANDWILFCLPCAMSHVARSRLLQSRPAAPLVRSVYRLKMPSCSFFSVRNDSLGSSWSVNSPLWAMVLSAVSMRFE